tara:strand:+ start:87 stop:608 length:522 start_codon:yes stop_codon:yes gene_type:complete
MSSNFILWFIGLPCSGKTTLAKILKEKLKEKKILLLDGDEIRRHICSDLDFSYESRAKSLERVAHIAKIANKNGIFSIISTITPLEIHREKINKILKSKVIFIYLDISLENCINRDVKGMYKMAKEGKIKNFTGIDSPFEVPTNANIIINTYENSISESVEKILKYLKTKKLI